MFSPEDIAANKERKIEKEKKKTEELFKLAEQKKERERVAAAQMPLVWDGAEWVFEDEHAAKKEAARIAREEAALRFLLCLISQSFISLKIPFKFTSF